MRAKRTTTKACQRRRRLVLVPITLSIFVAGSQASQSSRQPKVGSFATTIQPFISEHCIVCHNAKPSAGGLNLEAFHSTDDIAQNRDRGELIAQKLRSGEMHPKGMPQPNEAQT